ncbi:c-type cytochrome [Sulfurimonas sp. SAG-AH-194-L11]|nr:c-type cytochrome [Sulfurimonas sp. SAG-AH-194-L11]MDF1878009.1 c-type cytochrome [Sulfurimonas sp. SAG-AH-194-L11]
MFAATGYTLVETAGGKKDLSEVLSGDIVNTLAIAGAIALVIITVFVVIKYVRQMQVDTAGGELTEDSWDDIGEYYNPIPTGWAIIFLATMVWGMWYFIAGYPVNSYSQIGEYNEDVVAHNAKFEKEYASITGDRLIEMGESVFLAECKVCHGLSADGIDGKAADLNERIGLLTVKNVVINGSNNSLLNEGSSMPGRDGLMNANKDYAPITDAEIDAVSAYVANGMQGEGADVFAGACASCHGADGKGMEYVAPNIASYDTALLTNVLNHGKKGVMGTMPAFDRLSVKQKEAVSAYIISLSKGE